MSPTTTDEWITLLREEKLYLTVHQPRDGFCIVLQSMPSHTGYEYILLTNQGLATKPSSYYISNDPTETLCSCISKAYHNYKNPPDPFSYQKQSALDILRRSVAKRGKISYDDL